MLDIVDDEIKAGRKILIYVTHTKNRNTAKRVLELLTERMVKVRIMPDGNAKGRLRWIQKTAATTDVIICHPKKGGDRPQPTRIPHHTLVRTRPVHVHRRTGLSTQPPGKTRPNSYTYTTWPTPTPCRRGTYAS